jgi:hypothetical protein
MTKSGIECKYRAEKDFPFWLYDPEGDGLTFYRTGADRDRAAEDAIALYQAVADLVDEMNVHEYFRADNE